uniref:Tetraspanin-3-like n=1 Tax=Malurus cyaneus samueli TaxID=2593467 RepID=A0A8C5TJB2_9PASS
MRRVRALVVLPSSSRNKQGTLMYLLLLLLCLETSSAALAHSYFIKTSSQLEGAIDYLVHQHNWMCSQDPGSSAVDVMQRQLQCCGVHNYTDWLKASSSWHPPPCVPESCCKGKHSHYQVCFAMLYVFWCCTVLSILELLAGVSNGILMRHQPFHDFRFLDSYSFS